jgi:hypothetical protein
VPLEGIKSGEAFGKAGIVSILPRKEEIEKKPSTTKIEEYEQDKQDVSCDKE